MLPTSRKLYGAKAHDALRVWVGILHSAPPMQGTTTPNVPRSHQRRTVRPIREEITLKDVPESQTIGILNPKDPGSRGTFLMLGDKHRVDMRPFSDRPNDYGQLIRYAWAGTTPLPFPEGTQGFLYWHTEDESLPLLSHIRFRITESADPASFSAGTDLRVPSGAVWKVSLFDIARYQKNSFLRVALLSKGLVTSKLLSLARDISKDTRPDCFGDLIWKFGQPFSWSLSGRLKNVAFVGSSAVQVDRLCNFLSADLRLGKHIASKGTATLQFERSPLPEHKGTRTVVLRILKLTVSKGSAAAARRELTPVKEGDLALVHPLGRPPGARIPAPWIPWAINVDDTKGRRQVLRAGLKILFENEERAAQRESGSTPKTVD